MKRLRIIAIVMVVMAVIIAAIIPLILPASVGSQANEDFMAQVTVTIVLSLFAIVSAILFLLGLKDFKSEFKKTYYLICAGLVTQALALLVYPAAVYLNILGSSFTSYGGDLFYLVGAILIFAGLSRFAGLLKMSTWLRNFFIVGGVTIAGTAILWILPHTSVDVPELYFDITKSLISAEAILSVLSLLLVWSIRNRANLMYSRPLLWLMLALLANAGGELLYYTANHLPEPSGAPHDDIASISAIVFLASRILYIMASYSLILMTKKEQARQVDAQPVDVLTGMAALASNPTEIDALLEKLRHVTADLPANKTPTNEQLAVLRGLYYELEDYLINKEPLLKFTKESLQTRLEHQFGTIAFVNDKNVNH